MCARRSEYLWKQRLVLHSKWRCSNNTFRGTKLRLILASFRWMTTCPEIKSGAIRMQIGQHIFYQNFPYVCSQAKYLDITIHKHLNWYSEVQLLSSIMHQRSRFLGKDLRSPLGLKLFHTCTHLQNLRSMVDYRAIIQAPHSLQGCKNRILRRCVRVSRFYPRKEVYQLAKITPISERFCHLQQKFVTQSINSDNTSAQQILHTHFKAFPLIRYVPLSQAEKLPADYEEIL